MKNPHFTTNEGTFQSLHGHVTPGDTITAVFDIDPGCRVSVRLSSYYEALGRWGDPNTESFLDKLAIQNLGPGTGLKLGPISVPSCNFQVDLRVEFQGTITRLSSYNGGSSACAIPTATATCRASPGMPELQVSLDNPGPGGVSLTIRRSSSTTFVDTVQLAPGQGAVRTYAFGNIGTDTVLLSDNEDPPYRASIPVSWCGSPIVTGTFRCQSNVGVAEFTATSVAPLGGPPTVITITEGTSRVLSLAVPPADSVSGTVDYSPKQSPVFTALGPGGDTTTFPAIAFPLCGAPTAPGESSPPPTVDQPRPNTDVTAVPPAPVIQVVPPAQTVAIPPLSIPPVPVAIPTSTTSTTVAPAGLDAHMPGKLGAASGPNDSSSGPLSNAGPILSFTGATLRTLLSWVLLLSAAAAIVLLGCTFARRTDPSIPAL